MIIKSNALSDSLEFDPGSFRDPSGRVFRSEGQLYRTVSSSYVDTFNKLTSSGFYERLFEKGYLVRHTEIELGVKDCAKVIQPQLVPFISYPFEWCFSQLKEAALLTLRVQALALENGFTLKDSSAYNVQFVDNRPIFIDSLSFKEYKAGAPWEGYRQFCQHFLAPLVLMSRRDIRLQELLRVFIDGIPLDLTSSLLPVTSYLSPSVLFHIHLHARSQARHADIGRDGQSLKRASVSKNGLLGLIESLRSFIEGLDWRPKGTEWANYYSDNNYSEVGLEEKSRIVAEFVRAVSPKTTWDIGANAGYFSKIAFDNSSSVVAFDIDPAATEKHYRQVRGHPGPLPLIMDLTNPTSNFGWAESERSSFMRRGPADLVLALALVHHLAISNNVPLALIASFLSNLCNDLIIEFVPKDDSQVRRLLASREDIFPDYTEEGFERAFSKLFTISRAEKVTTSKRTIYLMRKR